MNYDDNHVKDQDSSDKTHQDYFSKIKWSNGGAEEANDTGEQ